MVKVRFHPRTIERTTDGAAMITPHDRPRDESTARQANGRIGGDQLKTRAKSQSATMTTASQTTTATYVRDRSPDSAPPEDMWRVYRVTEDEVRGPRNGSGLTTHGSWRLM